MPGLRDLLVRTLRIAILVFAVLVVLNHFNPTVFVPFRYAGF